MSEFFANLSNIFRLLIATAIAVILIILMFYFMAVIIFIGAIALIFAVVIAFAKGIVRRKNYDSFEEDEDRSYLIIEHEEFDNKKK